jgi:dTMP kinase
MEAAGEAFFARVRDGYRALVIAEPGRVVMLDGTADPDELHAQIWADLEALWGGTAPASSG